MLFAVLALLSIVAGCSRSASARLLALDRQTGAVRWERRLPTRAATSISIVNGSVAVEACAPRAQLRVDAATGGGQTPSGSSGLPVDGTSGLVYMGDPDPNNRLPISSEMHWKDGLLTSRRGWSKYMGSRGLALIPTVVTDDSVYLVLNAGDCYWND
jgi:hypothetical protein